MQNGHFLLLCHGTNYNVENYKVKIKKYFVPTISEVTVEQIKEQKLVRYSYHICGDTRHKIINCLKYNDMQNMFKNKGVKTTKKQVVVQPKVTNPLVKYNGCQHGHH